MMFAKGIGAKVGACFIACGAFAVVGMMIYVLVKII
jgi:hypothetical protein